MRCNLPLPKSEGAVLLLHPKVIHLDQLCCQLLILLEQHSLVVRISLL